MSVVPAQMPYIISHKESFSNVVAFLLGGSSIDDRLWNRIAESGLNAWESYGMTETASHIALRCIKGNSASRPRFVPMNGIGISVSEDECLKITDEDIVVKTNDLVKIFKDGSFLIKGRKDDMIITGGLKVLPSEIESVLAPYLKNTAKDFFITSEPHEVWTSSIVLVLVPLNNGLVENSQQGNELKENIQKIIDSISEKELPSRFRPKRIRLLPELPLTRSGKLIRI